MQPAERPAFVGLMVFDSTKEAWSHSITAGNRSISLSVDVLKNTPEEQHYAVHRNFLNTFDERWRQNESVMLILNGIILFSPDRPNIVNVALVSQIQALYYQLLSRFVDVRRSRSSANDCCKTETFCFFSDFYMLNAKRRPQSSPIRCSFRSLPSSNTSINRCSASTKGSTATSRCSRFSRRSSLKFKSNFLFYF